MVEAYLLKKPDLPKFIDTLLPDYEVIGPKLINGEPIFDYLQHGNDLVDSHTLLSPKEFLYPQTEEMLHYKQSEGKVIFSYSLDEKRRIIMGVRSCDVRGFQRIDPVLKEDPYYMSRRNNTLIFSFTCVTPCENGFCRNLGGPSLDKGYDLQFTDLGDTYLIEVGSERGKEITEKTKTILSAANNTHLKQKDSIVSKVLSELPDIRVNEVAEQISWDDPIFKELGEKCISCGACNFACPSCFCYNVADYSLPNGGYRERTWDSCLLAGFARMAADNPRESEESRMRQRISHKFKYYYEVYNTQLCTGCGRCYAVCPVKIDLRDVLKHFWEVKK